VQSRPRRITCGIPFRSAPPTPHPQHRKINCTLQNALVEKAAWWAAMRYKGLASKSLLKVRPRCKACHAEERAAFRSSPTIRSTTPPSAPPQNQLQLANAVAAKSA